MEDIIQIYSKIYGYLENTTPMLFDCGLLCENSCCSENGMGMFLFPGEDKYIDSLENDFKIVDSTFKVNGRTTKLLICNGCCNRNFRPISCRIFPLFPFYRNGRISIDFDPRAKGTCPLLFKDIEEIYVRGLFRLKVLQTAYEMISHEQIRIFLEQYTKEVDEISRFRF